MELIFHSDQGVQYTCEELRNTLDKNVVQSMFRRGNCWDNAVAESFFKSLKCELIYGYKLLSAERVDLEIFEHIEIFYNKIRGHSALKNRTIDEFNKLNKIPASPFVRVKLGSPVPFLSRNLRDISYNILEISRLAVFL